MHVMTKFLIVACAVLCLLLSALTVAFSANVDRITDSFRSERALRLAAQAAGSLAEADAGEKRSEWEKETLQRDGAIRERNETISRLQGERTELVSLKERAVAEAAANRGELEQLSAANKTYAEIIKSYREEVAALRTEQLAAARQSIELGDRVNDLTSQNEVLEQTARALREQLAEVQLAMQNAASGVKAGAKGQPFDPAGLRVRGTVTDVIKTDAGDELAVIDIGTNKGLQENMRLNIVRGSEFIALLVVTKVDPGTAVGRIDKLKRAVTVNKGDTIQSSLQ